MPDQHEQSATLALSRGDSLETYLTSLPLSQWPTAERAYKAAKHTASIRAYRPPFGAPAKLGPTIKGKIGAERKA